MILAGDGEIKINKSMKHKILLGLTTTEGSDWRGKIKEIKKYIEENILK